MKLFTRYFRKAPPSPLTLQQRIALLNAASLNVILDAALGSEEESLRLAAIRILPDGEALRKLAGVTGAADDAARVLPIALERASQARMAQLIDEGSVSFLKFCDQAANQPVMLSIAALCRDPERLPQALKLFVDKAQVAQLVLTSPSSRVRQLAAEAIEDPTQLRQLLKQVRSKDKNVYKILKQRCDALNAEDRRAAQRQAEIEAICASLEGHSYRTFDALYAQQFERLQDRWQSLGAVPTGTVPQRANAAIERCREVIETQLRQAALRAAEQAAQQAAQRAARDSTERSQQAAAEAAAIQADVATEVRQQLAAARDAEERARAAAHAAEEQHFRQIGALLRKANGALGDGNTQRAAGVRRALEEKLATAPALPPYLTRHLQQLDEKLQDLKQWKDYAVAPKRTELIEAMEALIGSTDEPQMLADRIKSLQEDWRTTSKGITDDAPQAWERFNQAAQTAYQPCREFFAAQTQLRAENLEHRKAVLQRLAAFENSQTDDNTDWRLVASVLREAPQEWRRYFPVDREASRIVQVDFSAAMRRLQGKLDGWYERNVAAKLALIERAREVLAQGEGRDAIDGVRHLQVLWKETGTAPRDRDQSLWSAFRELCDAVYQKRELANVEYISRLEANKAQAVALCEQAERVAAATGPDLLEAGKKIVEWGAAFATLAEMPRADERGLRNRFERAVDLCKAQLAEQRIRDTEQSFVDLLEAGRHVQAYAWAVASNAGASEAEMLKQNADTFIRAVQRWPKDGMQAITAAIARSALGSAAHNTPGELTLRMLCIRSEILNETPTPAEDEALRRDYQVQRLMRGMGQGSHGDEEDWQAMAIEWVQAGAVPPLLHAALLDRFLRGRGTRSAYQSPRSGLQKPAHQPGRESSTAAGTG